MPGADVSYIRHIKSTTHRSAGGTKNSMKFLFSYFESYSVSQPSGYLELNASIAARSFRLTRNNLGRGSSRESGKLGSKNPLSRVGKPALIITRRLSAQWA